MHQISALRHTVGLLAACTFCLVIASCKETVPTQPNDQIDTVTIDTGIDTFENDDLPAQAGSLNQISAQVHTLDGEDVDWMKLTVDSGEVVSFMVTSKCSVIVAIVASADLEHPIFTDTGMSIVHTLTFLYAVDLYVVVSAPVQVKDTIITYSVLAYSNHVVGSQIAKDSFEVSESAMISTMLVSGGQWQVHNFHSENDRDYFKAFLSGDSLYTIYCESPEPDYSIRINGSRGNALADGQGYFNHSFYDSERSVRIVPEVSDTFSFILRGSSPDTFITYRIRIKADTLPYKADSFEPDSSFTSGTVLAADGVVQHHTLHVPSDKDFFRIALSKDSVYTCSLWTTDNYIGRQIYDRTKTVKKTTFNNSSSSYNFAANFSQEVDDTVYLLVKTDPDEFAEYTINLIARKNPCLPDSFERDTRLAPVVVSDDDTLKRSFHFQGDTDFIYIKPLTPCFVHYSISTDSALSLNNFVYLNKMSESPKWTDYHQSSVAQPIYKGIWTVFPDSGLFIKSTTDRTYGQYTIALNFTDSIASRDEYEWDDRPSLADTMPANGVARRYSIWPANDVDWILFRMAPDSVYTISLDRELSRFYLTASCFGFENSSVYRLSRYVTFGTPDTLQEKTSQSRIYGYRISFEKIGYSEGLSSPAWYTIKITSRKREE
jgi:hypothetical protein